jgi:hypothetical protein
MAKTREEDQDTAELFADLDLESASDDPFAVAEGTWYATVTDFYRKNPKDEAKRPGFLLEYTFDMSEDEDDEQSEVEGDDISEWFTIPEKGDMSKEARRQRSFLRRRMLSLGVPEAALSTVTREDLIDTKVVLTVTKNGEYTNVSKVSLRDDE